MPIGHINIGEMDLPIYVMDDLFLNYTFENKENRETLRSIVNLTLLSCAEMYAVSVPLIEGKITVKTQYKHLFDGKKKPKTQDVKITEQLPESPKNDLEKITFVEFQNRANVRPPVKAQAMEYFVLGISSNKGKTVNQIWLMAEDLDELMHGNVFSCYRLKDEITGKRYPEESCLTFISLPKLSEQKSAAGELAGFLIGRETGSTSDEVKNIINALKKSFEEFKIINEVRDMYTLRERLMMEIEYDQSEKWQSVVAEKDNALAEKDTILAEKDTALAEKESTMSKMAMEIERLKALLLERENQ
jgi:hypothetical protein